MIGPALTDRRGVVRSISMSPDGRSMASASNQATIWDIGQLIDLQNAPVGYACAMTGTGLDRELWRRYVPALPYQRTC